MNGRKFLIRDTRKIHNLHNTKNAGGIKPPALLFLSLDPLLAFTGEVRLSRLPFLHHQHGLPKPANKITPTEIGAVVAVVTAHQSVHLRPVLTLV